MDLNAAAHLITRVIDANAHQWEKSPIGSIDLTIARVNVNDALPYTLPTVAIDTLFTGWTAAMHMEQTNTSFERRIPWGNPRLESAASAALECYEEDLLNYLDDAGYPGDLTSVHHSTGEWIAARS